MRAPVNETLTEAGQTQTHVSNSPKCLLAVIAETCTTHSVQLQAYLDGDWVAVGSPITTVATSVIDVPSDVPLRAAFTGTGITSIQIGIGS